MTKVVNLGSITSNTNIKNTYLCVYPDVNNQINQYMGEETVLYRRIPTDTWRSDVGNSKSPAGNTNAIIVDTKIHGLMLKSAGKGLRRKSVLVSVPRYHQIQRKKE